MQARYLAELPERFDAPVLPIPMLPLAPSRRGGRSWSGTTDTWRGVARYVANQLALAFGDSVHVVYHDLFDPGCPPLPEGAQLPLVLVDGTVVSSGEKLRAPAIRRSIEVRQMARVMPEP